MIRAELGTFGDSGAAVITWLDDGNTALGGLYIASSDEQPMAYVIPTWQLFNPANGSSLPPGTTAMKPVRA